MAVSSRDCFLSIRSEEWFSAVLIVTEKGALSITTVSKHRSPYLRSSSFDHRKSLRANAGPQYDMVTRKEEQPIRVGGTTTNKKLVPPDPDYIISAYGWNVRDINRRKQKDVQEVARIQADAFHNPPPIFKDFFYDLFKAEILSAVAYKTRLSQPDRYTCLVAETGEDKRMVGVVDLTVLDKKDVLQYLPDAGEYVYVSSLCVEAKYRRRSVATALLQGVDVKASEWGLEHLVLHVYEDDVVARKAYTKAGYKVIAMDPVWSSTLIGQKRRVVMAKRSPKPVAAAEEKEEEMPVPLNDDYDPDPPE